MDALEVLMEEHEIILKATDTLKQSSELIARGSSVSDQFYYNFIDLIVVFVDGCHHSKEETVLFPLVKQKQHDELTSIARLGEEHERGRQFIRGLKESVLNCDDAEKVNNAVGYAQLLTAHISRENDLFPVWIGSLSEADRGYLFEKFEEIEEKVIGLGKHEEYVRRIEGLKNML